MTSSIAITPGEPAGIGLDILIQLAQHHRSAGWVVVTDPDALRARAKLLDLELRIDETVDDPACDARRLTVWPIRFAQPPEPGVLQVDNAQGVLDSLDIAADGALQGRFDAIVTGPIQKSVINDLGVSFSGHTEYLAAASKVNDVVMMLATEHLRVALATTHLPLAEVAAALTADLLKRRLMILHQSLKERFLLSDPVILVCGLNPHAGEGGHLGREEIDVIIPVCDELRALGMQLIGPLPADTLFTPKNLKQADAVMAMYHDQGLPVLKYSGFGEAVNVTLGLPFIRTSVDHGTALDIAGTGQADSSSLSAAIRLAGTL